MRDGDELRGNSASLRVAAKRSSIGRLLSRAIALRRARRGPKVFDIRFRRLFFSIELFFAIYLSSLFPRLRWPKRPSLPEREVECCQQSAPFFVVARAGANGDVHAPGIGDLVEVDFRENGVFLDADAVVAAAVEALRVEPAEVADTRQRDGHQAVDEVVHARLGQRDLTTDGLAVAQLVV